MPTPANDATTTTALSEIEKYNQASSLKQKFWHTIANAAVGIEPLYSGFLFLASLGASGYLLKVLAGDADHVEDDDFNESAEWDIAWWTLAGLSGVCTFGCNLANDLITTLPTQEAFDLITGNSLMAPVDDALDPNDDNNDAENPEGLRLSACQKGIAKTLAIATLSVPAISSFAALAASDAVTIVDMDKDQNSSYVIGATVTTLGVFYYFAMSKEDVVEHSIFFVKQASDLFIPLLKDFYQQPANALAVTKQCITTLAYRSIAAAYVVYTLGLPTNLVLGALASTALVTVLSRFLSPYNKYFKPEFAKLTREHLAKAKEEHATSTKLLWRAISTLSQGLPAAVITYEYAKDLNPLWQIAIASLTGIAVTAHDSYTTINNQINNAALAIQSQERITGQPLASGSEDPTDVLTQQLLPTNAQGPGNIAPNTAVELFNLISKSRDPRKIQNAMSAINVGARYIRLISFVGFLHTLINDFATNDLKIDIDMPPLALVSAAVYIGVNIAIAEYLYYQNKLIESANYHVTKHSTIPNNIPQGSPSLNAEPTARGGRCPSISEHYKIYNTPSETYNVAQLRGVAEKLGLITRDPESGVYLLVENTHEASVTPQISRLWKETGEQHPDSPDSPDRRKETSLT
jgi:hypothetical protein